MLYGLPLTTSPAVRVRLDSVIAPAVVSSIAVTLLFQSVTLRFTRPVKVGVVAFTLGSFVPYVLLASVVRFTVKLAGVIVSVLPVVLRLDV